MKSTQKCKKLRLQIRAFWNTIRPQIGRKLVIRESRFLEYKENTSDGSLFMIMGPVFIVMDYSNKIGILYAIEARLSTYLRRIRGNIRGSKNEK